MDAMTILSLAAMAVAGYFFSVWMARFDNLQVN